MTASWSARNVTVVGSETGPAQVLALTWKTEDPELVGLFPWATPEYPCLHLLHVEVTLTVIATLPLRRVRLIVSTPLANAQLDYQSAGTTTNGQSKRVGFGGYQLDSTAIAVTHLREPLPTGVVVLPPATVQVQIVNPQVGDALTNLMILGELILPERTLTRRCQT